MSSYNCLFSLGSIGGLRGLLLAAFAWCAITAASFAEAPTADATDSTAIKPAADKAVEKADEQTDKAKAVPKRLPPPADAQPMPGAKNVWINRNTHTVYVDGAVSLRQGVLEMFACPKGTKEHESVVALDCKAYLVHTSLLAVGAKSGTPVRFVEEYIPPTGDVIDVSVQWIDPAGKRQTARAQQWVKDVKTGKAMTCEWVFAGSGFWKDEQTGKNHYMAEGGDLICVANFSTATLDVTAESTQANDGLMFEAFTEHVPALGTPVRVVLTAKPAADKPADGLPANGEPADGVPAKPVKLQ
ncbi:hypothetical protein Pla123a_26770 [Posidoniimonas polymericola]|uniref:SLA1 homology domain-containing protein n=1 Tax=Posidoniimonas polymericola TaxID=2528002 RepID=A0A5C5YLQ6_9BACT|nr:YdjY domain-containing protein [Posidoniimonas polymericola]TWT75893.1 hypothetical protein Pla123a_26770 [Posidoniimonas polymericola]